MLRHTLSGALAAAAASIFAHGPAAAQPPGVTFWAGGEFVYMMRTGTSSRDLSFLDASVAGCPCTVLSTRDIDPQGQNGYRAFAGFSWDGGRHGLEASFMQWRTARRAKSVVNAGENLQPFLDPTQFDNNDIDDYTDAFAHTATYKSTFQTFEINFKHQAGTYWGIRTAFIVGLRVANLRESLAFETLDSSTNAPSAYNIGTRNRMIGGQIGLALHRPIEFVPGLGVGGEVLVGVLGNNARQTSRLLNDNGGDVTDTSISRTRATTMIQAAAKITYEPIQSVVIFVGYQMLNFNGVALAPQQFGEPNRLKTSSSVIYHGPFAGVKIRFGG